MTLSYQKYRQHMAELSMLKKRLKEAVEKQKIQRSKYYKYLEENPYKKEYHELMAKVTNLRKKLIEMIPEEV